MTTQIKGARKVAVRAKNTTAAAPDRVSIRMYCLGTGDCFVIKFFSRKTTCFTMMIDCGSCKGTPAAFAPYLNELKQYVNNAVDLLIVTHEHNDHVDGFAKHPDIFEQLEIREAWFAWTENPDDPNGYAQELQTKRGKMRAALHNAINAVKDRHENLKIGGHGEEMNSNFNRIMLNNSAAFIDGLDTLASINLHGTATGVAPLPGMRIIKDILIKKKVKIRYLNPGDIVSLPLLQGVKFNVLGPPTNREFIFKDGKAGTDVYRKNLTLNDSALCVNAFLALNNSERNDVPFISDYIAAYGATAAIYNSPGNQWRKINDDWLSSAGSLALRLNSHINNTSLALAIEFEKSGKVLLFPGDAEYGSWESWHQIKKWEKKGRDGRHLTECLLNRTVFYKVGHHLSYNGTALEKGILMMESEELAAMATLDRRRIAEKWKSTMPNRLLLQELIKRCQGKVFIMDEYQLCNRPSHQLDPHTLGKRVYEEGWGTGPDAGTLLYKQYAITNL